MNEPFLNLLHQEHEQVSGFIRDIESTPPERTDELNDRWAALKRSLLPHIVAEENTFYPVLNNKSESQNDALRSLEDHHAIEAVLFEVNNMPWQPFSEWMNRFNKLKDMIGRHIQFEETTIFQDTARVLSANEQNDIMQKYQKAEENAKSSMVGPGYTREGS
jgi:hemerythrin-like domain-containing protein